MNTFTESTACPVAVCVKIDFAGLLTMAPPLSFAWSETVEKAIDRALREKGVLAGEAPCAANNFTSGPSRSTVHCRGSATIAIFEVTDWRIAVAAIRDELARLKVLSYSKFGWHDEYEGMIRMVHPAATAEPFRPFIETLVRWLREAIALQKDNPPAT
jgi:hypothetical protein